MLEFKTRLVKPALTLIAAAALAACTPSSDGPKSPPKPPKTGVAKFSLGSATTNPDLPWPADPFFFSGTTDGTLNIPAMAFRSAAMQAALNSQDGWSTSASITTAFSLPIDAASISGTAVKLVKIYVDPNTKAPATNPAYLPAGATSFIAKVLTYGTDYTADVSPDFDSEGKILRITPLKPLDYSRGPTYNAITDGGANAGKILNVAYLVLITDSLKATNGTAFEPDTFYADIKNAPADCGTFTGTPKLICQFTKPQLAIAQAVGVTNRLILSWSFSTQALDDTFAALSLGTSAKTTLIVPTGLNTHNVSASLPGHADIYVGSTVLPYYLTPAANTHDATSIQTKFWTAAGAPPAPLDPTSRNLTMLNPMPAKMADVTVPVLVTIPNASSTCGGVKPAGGWPVVIVQHGITGNRSQALAVADAFADACIVMAAIDLPLHGIVDTTSPLYCNPSMPQCIGASERTFDLDILNNTTGASQPAGDGKIDSSGSQFINLTSPATGRDNLRQAEADLMTFTKSVTGITIAPGTPAPAGPIGVDPTRVHFVGLSLGSIVGGGHIEFTGAGTRTATLAVPGGVITKLLMDSQTFGPVIKAGLSAQLIPDSYLYNLYMRDFQAVVDSGDPINHIQDTTEHAPVHLIKVLNDTVVPNNSTDRLITQAPFRKLKTLGPNPVGLNTTANIAAGAGAAYTFFKVGSHGSLFDPTASLAATVEMQKEAVLFAATAGAPGGPFVYLTDATVLDLN